MQRNNFNYLLVALLIFIVIVPIAAGLDLISVRVSRLLAIPSLLAVGVWSLRGTGRLYVVSIALVIAGIAMSLAAYARADDSWYVISQLLLFAFLGLATFNNLRQVAAGNDISLNRIIGAICVYLTLGVMWSIAFSILEGTNPGSFAGLNVADGGDWESDWIYFSFVTITTLGYGDILPLTTTARSLALFEAIVGQFYIAILVAGLVSAYISAKATGKDQG